MLGMPPFVLAALHTILGQPAKPPFQAGCDLDVRCFRIPQLLPGDLGEMSLASLG